MGIADYELTVRQIEERLPDYFISMGVKPAGNAKNKHVFHCFNSNYHKGGSDTAPSLHIDSRNSTPRFKCFGCNISGNIFDAARLIENLDPENDFVGVAKYLAEKFGIPFTMTHEGTITHSGIMTHISKYIKHHSDYRLYMNDTYGRKYTEELAIEANKVLPMAEIDPDHLDAELREEFGNRYLEHLEIATKTATGLKLPTLFHKNRATCTLVNNKNRPIAFMSRATNTILKEVPSIPKFLYSTPFNKNKELPIYFLHISSRSIQSSKRVYIVEGVFDALSMYLSGYTNVVALLGTNLSENAAESQAISILSSYDIREAVLCLDDDNAGNTARDKIFSVLATNDIPVFTVDLKGKDPDDLVISGETSQFNDLIDMILFTLNKNNCFRSDSKTSNRSYLECLEFIVTHSKTRAMYRSYSPTISATLGLPQQEVEKDLESFLDRVEKNTPFINAVRSKLKSAESMIPEELLTVLDDVRRDLSSYVNKNSLGIQDITANLFNTFVKPNAGDVVLPYLFRTGDSYYDDVIRLESKSLAFISAPPSNMKSTFMRAMILKIIKYDPTVLGVYISLDDTREKTMMGIIAAETGLGKNEVEDMIRKSSLVDTLEQSKIYELMDLFKNRLFIIGKETTPSMPAVSREMEKLREANPDKNIICVIDAMDDLSDLRVSNFGNITGLVAVENLLSEISERAVIDDICFVAIKHLKHDDYADRRPSLGKIKGTSKVEYIAKTILLVYMDMHYNQGTRMRWTSNDNRILPVLEIHVAKEKDTPANTMRFVEIDPSTLDMRNTPAELHSFYMSCYNSIVDSKKISGGYTNNYDDDISII